ncbi:hypothetical protein [Jiangella mangrovi]|uniref:Uncharacterized protein n=1 Tax=Jiangella mangrovi TaxID=1524084 RepID=A0A7W9GQX4_9ACTN|nr:hypothetical protein [Jiangella mangrovi]MBB5788242.1 hypothetical protein [Jiangella mangrovi]
MTAARLVRTAVVLVLPVVLFGCAGGGGDVDVAVSSSGSGAGADGVQVRSAGSVAPRTGGLTLPLDAYALSAAEDRALGRAAEDQVRECAAAAGLTEDQIDPLPFGTAAESSAAVAARHDRRYSVADPEVAATYGYHPPVTADVRREFYEAHTDAELEVLVGCLSEAAAVSSAAGSASVSGAELVSEVQASAWHAAMADPRVVDAFAAWSSCLAAAGFDYAAPMEANDDPRWWTSEVAGPLEIETAVADVACKQSTGLIPVWSAVEAEHQETLIAAHQAELDAYRVVLDEQVAEAARFAG